MNTINDFGMDFEKMITESDSMYRHIEKMSVSEIITCINNEDKKVANAVEEVLENITAFISAASKRMEKGGRLFYIGAGTSGRLGVLDASECVPTFGVPKNLVTGIIAGGDEALKNAVEFAEDNIDLGWDMLQSNNVSCNDVVLGLSASGNTPYVVHALKSCRNFGILTGSISCNKESQLSKVAEFPIEVIVGPEFITGSTRMKAGTAQKMVLNMISTTLMITLGRIEDNKMVNMQLTNKKLVSRGVRMVMKSLNITDPIEAEELLRKYGNVKKVILTFGK